MLKLITVPNVRMSLCSHIPKMTCPDFTKFSVHVTYSFGSVLLW